jgi:hypothetical protein
MSQADLFGNEIEQEPAYRPDPDKVRARLERILSQARTAELIPWEPTQLSLFCTIVPDMTRWLPDEEGARWRAEFEEQLARLGVAA